MESETAYPRTQSSGLLSQETREMRLLMRMTRINAKSDQLPCTVTYSREAVAQTELYRAVK